MSQTHETAPDSQGPVDRPVRPRAWLAQVDSGNIRCWTSNYTESLRLAREIGHELTPLFALPQELADYLMRHLRHERAALDGFVALGNEVVRAQRLDGWIAALEGPNAELTGDPLAGRPG